MRLLIPLLAAAALAVAPAAASADSPVTPAPGAVNLAAGGGYLVWFAPNEDTGWRLVVRAPDGTVSTPSVAGFPGPSRASIGSDTFSAAGRRLVAVYSRGGDVFLLNLRTGAEERVRRAATRTYEEYSPSISFGRIAFARRGGRTNGVFYDSGRSLRRVTSARPREVAFNGSRVAYPSGRNVVIRRTSGEGRPSVVATPSQASSLQLSRYSLTWLTRDGRVFRTPRFGGSSEVDRVATGQEATRRLPVTTQSIANSGSDARWFLDSEGVKLISPRLEFAQR